MITKSMENARLRPARSWTRLGREDMLLTQNIKDRITKIGIVSIAILGVLHVFFGIPVGYSDAAVAISMALAMSPLIKQRNTIRAQDELNEINSRLNSMQMIVPGRKDLDDPPKLYARRARLQRKYNIK